MPKILGRNSTHSNGKIRFSFFRPQYFGSPLQAVYLFRSGTFPAEIRRSIFDKPVIYPNYGIRKDYKNGLTRFNRKMIYFLRGDSH